MTAPNPNRTFGATPVSRFVPQLTAEAMRKHGFANYALLANWRQIAGPAFADFALPLRLTTQNGSRNDVLHADTPGQQRAATLILKVDPSRSLEIQYVVPQLIERINACLGYRAVSAIRLVQMPLRAQGRGKAPVPAPVHAPDAKESECDGDRLARALSRLAKSRARKTAQIRLSARH